ncbi:MAG: class I SAM-dependent methyltransferase [Bacteroidetes bacterium]|nr:class I SAM-dependent methyltransferase [Bacteroidota bacterium]
MTILNNCPCCKATQFVPYIVCKDYTVSNEIFTIVNCLSCNFKFTNPRPLNEDLGRYYKSEDYISHSNTSKGLVSKLYHLVRSYTLKKKLSLVSKYVSRGTILDYGCGTGMFLNECKRAGWKTYGLEPDKGAREITANMNLNAFESKAYLKDAMGSGQVNAITLWHVLEHINDLEDTLGFFSEKLAPNGVLVIAVPNYLSFDAQHYKEYWAAYDVPRHLYHFEINSVSLLLKPYGFKLVETQPMKFDSFYVSMLSEKYKTGKINYVQAFLTGLRSNLKAEAAQDYSSVIYVFKKM